jgi:hypothetical protein
MSHVQPIRADHCTVNTSLATVYKIAFEYDAVAGVGTFEGSYVRPFIETLRSQDLNGVDVIPYTSLALASNLVSDVSHSIAMDASECRSETCDSFFISGGLPLSWPWPPTNFSDSAVVILNSVPGIQVQFERTTSNETLFTDEDCDLFYAKNFLIAIRFCIAAAQLQRGALHAGEFVEI